MNIAPVILAAPLVVFAAQDGVVPAIERLGLPTAILVAVGFGAMKVARWMGRRIDDLIVEHKKLLASLDRELKANGRVLEKVGRAQETFATTQEQLATSQGEVLACHREMRDLVRVIRESSEDEG